MDFVNLMNQINNQGCVNDMMQNFCNNNNNSGIGNGILPLLLLTGLGNNHQNNGGTLTCYPANQYGNSCYQGVQPYVIPNSDLNLRYRTRRVRQAYVEVPVSTYQVINPICTNGSFLNSQCPTTMNIMPFNNQKGNMDLGTILLLMCLLNKCNNNYENNGNMCHPNPRPQPRSSASEL